MNNGKERVKSKVLGRKYILYIVSQETSLEKEYLNMLAL